MGNKNSNGKGAKPKPPATPPVDVPLEATARIAQVDVPLEAIDKNAYQVRHVELQSMSPLQRTTLAMMFKSLGGSKMANGRFVNSPADAVRFLLDEIGRIGEVEVVPCV